MNHKLLIPSFNLNSLYIYTLVDFLLHQNKEVDLHWMTAEKTAVALFFLSTWPTFCDHLHAAFKNKLILICDN